MKFLFIVTAVIEAGVGVALLVSPAVVVSLLLGTALETSAAMAVSRIAGAALLSLGVACWWARHDNQSPAATGLIVAMLFYNIAVVAILVAANINSGLFGIALWPAVVLHVVMAMWCLGCLRMRRASSLSGNGNSGQ